jgi:hypothetical protein
MRYLLILLALCWTARGANPSFEAFNTNQFRTNGNKIAFRGTTSADYTIMTNVHVRDGTLWVESPAEFRISGSGTEGEGRILVSDVNGVAGWRTNIPGSFTFNDITILTNMFFVSGKGNTLVITQSLTIQALKTNLVATTSTGLLTNANYGTGIAWDPSTLTISATASGDTTGTNIVTLTQTGTNVPQLDFSLVARGGAWKLQLTNNAYIGAPANVASSPFSQAWLVVQQPSTGTCFLTFTNGFWQFPEGVAPIIDTNNGAVTIYQFISDPISNGLVHGTMSLKSKLIP